MPPDTEPQIPSDVDERGDKCSDRVAYEGIGVYSLINIAWIAWAFSGAGFGIFHTAIVIGIAVPILGLLSLIGFQFYSPQKRFSILANVHSILALVGWFFAVWFIVAAASASV